MCSEELFLSNGALGLNVGKSRNFESKLENHSEEIRTFIEGGRICVYVQQLTVCNMFS